jgi:putative transposase
MRKTYKYRLYPTKKQVQKLNWTLDMCRILYNSCLLDRKRNYEQTGKGLSRIRQQEILKSDKGTVESLKEIHSQVLQDVLFRVDKAFQSFFRRVKAGEKPGYPRFKGESRYDSITYPQEPAFQITEQGLKLSKIGTIKIKLHRSIQGRFKTCIIKREKKRWYACFSVEYEPINNKPVPVGSIGIDVGIKSFAVLSDSTVIDNPRYLRKSENKLISKQRQLSKKKKGSNNRKKARLTVARLHRKIKNQRSDFHHQASRKIVDNYGFIAVEDLNIKGMARNHSLAKSIYDAGWGQFVNYLQYKAAEAGVQIEKVSPHYTSIDCSVCGNPVPKALANRMHKCSFCNVVLDRDHNAAQNILLKSTAGTAGSYACGDTSGGGTDYIWTTSHVSLNQEALSVNAG